MIDYLMSDNEDKILMEKLKEAFDSLLPQGSSPVHPKEALPLGTYVRASRLDRLGVIVDSFYGDVDKDNQKIIVYSVLLFPKKGFSYDLSKKTSPYYVVNEYEYDIIAYLMIKPADMSQFNSLLDGNLF